MTARILLVEDDEAVIAAYRQTLEAAGHKTQSVETGEEAMRAFRAFGADLVLLDLKLAGEVTGMDVLQAIRRENTAARVIIITAQRDQEMQVFGLEHGADDYVVKTIPPPILLARVNAQLRRAPAGESLVGRGGEVQVDLGRNLVWRGSRRFVLGDTERRVLARLLQTPDRAVSFNELSLAGWDIPLPRPYTENDLAGLDGCIYRLREKLGSEFIVATGGGYVVAVPEAEVLEQAGAGARARA
jgi:DNA-binding response OmpR family regulator